MAENAQQQEIPVEVQKEYFEKQLEDLKSKEEEQLYFQLDQVQSAKLVFANRLDQIAKEESPIVKPKE